jgi:hypothetical protein
MTSDLRIASRLNPRNGPDIKGKGSRVGNFHPAMLELVVFWSHSESGGRSARWETVRKSYWRKTGLLIETALIYRLERTSDR